MHGLYMQDGPKPRRPTLSADGAGGRRVCHANLHCEEVRHLVLGRVCVGANLFRQCAIQTLDEMSVDSAKYASWVSHAVGRFAGSDQGAVLKFTTAITEASMVARESSPSLGNHTKTSCVSRSTVMASEKGQANDAAKSFVMFDPQHE